MRDQYHAVFLMRRHRYTSPFIYFDPIQHRTGPVPTVTPSHATFSLHAPTNISTHLFIVAFCHVLNTSALTPLTIPSTQMFNETRFNITRHPFFFPNGYPP